VKLTVKKTFVIVNLLLLLLTIFAYQSHLFQKIEFILLDNHMKKTASHQPDDRIIVIAIDDYSLEELGQFPWDRAIYATLLDQLNQEQFEPSAIAFDIVYSEPSVSESDDIFAEALSRYNNVILPSVATTTGAVFRTSKVKEGELLQVDGFTNAYSLFSQWTENAHINRVVSLDGLIRQTWLKLQNSDHSIVPSLAYKAAEMAGADLSSYDELTDRKKTKDPIAKNTISIKYNLVTEDFLTVPFVDVLYGNIPPETFQDSIVLIGFTATGLSGESGQDSGVTPLERDTRLVYVHGNIINQLLEGSSISFTSNTLEIVLMILLFIIFLWLPWRFKNQYTFIALIATIGLIMITQRICFQNMNLQMNITYMIFGIIVVYLFNVSLKSFLDQSQKNFVTRQFGRYISPDLVEEIVKKGMDIQLGGISKVITILFLDIRGFTSLSEKLAPAEVVDVLNTKFTMITDTVLKNQGSIDKFIGDAAMILFNAPLDVEEHQLMAVKTAVDIQQNMKPIKQQLYDKYGVEVSIGIGIHTGSVVIGNIGSYLRMDYTAIGDTVNIASRIESGTTAGQILVSEDVYEATKEIFEYGIGEERMFKGKSHPIKIYEVYYSKVKENFK